MEPESFSTVLDDFVKKIIPGMVHWTHKDFFAYYGAGVAYPSVLADFLAAGVSTVGFSWASCPALTELETIVLDWLGRAIGLCDEFMSVNTVPESEGGGCLQGSASDAIYACVMAARARIIKKLKGDNNDVHDNEFLQKLVCYASSEAHSSTEKAAKLALVHFRVVPSDENDKLRGAALEKAIAEDVNKGLVPFMVLATAGTTSQCAFDDFVEIGEVVKKYPDMWFHIDAAYGGNAYILPEMEALRAGVNLSDSINMNPNKFLLTNFDASCLWVKNVKSFIETFLIDPLYLVHDFNKKVVDLRHFGVPLSRRFRSLKLFFLLRMYGLEKLQNYCRLKISMGKYLAELIQTDDCFEIMNKPDVGLVCFRLK